jgi:hypothetical protein
MQGEMFQYFLRQNGTNMGLYHPLDGDTNLKYKLLCFLTQTKKIQRERH